MKHIVGDIKGEPRIDRRQLEVCVFSYLMAALRSGDVTVKGSESFADHRDQLLTIEETRELLNGYCDRLGVPKTAPEIVAHLKTALTNAAQQADAGFLSNDELRINVKGEPIVRRTRARPVHRRPSTCKQPLSRECRFAIYWISWPM
jgi:hypothetical protein